MARKDKLLARLRARPRDYTWAEGCSVMAAHGFSLENRSGSRRMFRHEMSGAKVILHEPHNRPHLLPYEIALLIDGLKEVGVIIE